MNGAMSTLKAPDYGPKISNQERTRRSIERLEAPPQLDDPKEEELRKERAMINDMIDNTLGIDFPAARREEVLAVQLKILRQYPLILAGAVIKRPWAPLFGIFSSVVKRMSLVLSPAELAAMFELSEEEIRAYLGKARYQDYLRGP